MTYMRLALPIALVTLSAAAAAQQTVPFRNNTPVAPSGIPPVPLPSAPVEYATAEGQKIRVVVQARGMTNPWSLVFLPNGDMLITERPGRACFAMACSTRSPWQASR